jgi:hypothetical protein
MERTAKLQVEKYQWKVLPRIYNGIVDLLLPLWTRMGLDREKEPCIGGGEVEASTSKGTKLR